MSGIVDIVSCHKDSLNISAKLFTYGHEKAITHFHTEQPSCGTTVTVQDFMYNMPVRKKMVKEAIDIENIKCHIERIALILPYLSISLRNEKKKHKVLDIQKRRSLLESFTKLFGSEHENNLAEVYYSLDQFEISGYISTQPHQTKGLQFIYINKRSILQTRIHSVINELLSRSSIIRNKAIPNTSVAEPGKIPSSPPKGLRFYGVFVLNITCPHKYYDICLEPKKTLIEFADWEKVLLCLEELILKFIKDEGLTISLDERFRRSEKETYSNFELPIPQSSQYKLEIFSNPKKCHVNNSNFESADLAIDDAKSMVYGMPIKRKSNNEDQNLQKIHKVSEVHHVTSNKKISKELTKNNKEEIMEVELTCTNNISRKGKTENNNFNRDEVSNKDEIIEKDDICKIMTRSTKTSSLENLKQITSKNNILIRDTTKPDCIVERKPKVSSLQQLKLMHEISSKEIDSSLPTAFVLNSSDHILHKREKNDAYNSYKGKESSDKKTDEDQCLSKMLGKIYNQTIKKKKVMKSLNSFKYEKTSGKYDLRKSRNKNHIKDLNKRLSCTNKEVECAEETLYFTPESTLKNCINKKIDINLNKEEKVIPNNIKDVRNNSKQDLHMYTNRNNVKLVLSKEIKNREKLESHSHHSLDKNELMFTHQKYQINCHNHKENSNKYKLSNYHSNADTNIISNKIKQMPTEDRKITEEKNLKIDKSVNFKIKMTKTLNIPKTQPLENDISTEEVRKQHFHFFNHNNISSTQDKNIFNYDGHKENTKLSSLQELKHAHKIYTKIDPLSCVTPLLKATSSNSSIQDKNNKDQTFSESNKNQNRLLKKKVLKKGPSHLLGKMHKQALKEKKTSAYLNTQHLDKISRDNTDKSKSLNHILNTQAVRGVENSDSPMHDSEQLQQSFHFNPVNKMGKHFDSNEKLLDLNFTISEKNFLNDVNIEEVLHNTEIPTALQPKTFLESSLDGKKTFSDSCKDKDINSQTITNVHSSSDFQNGNILNTKTSFNNFQSKASNRSDSVTRSQFSKVDQTNSDFFEISQENNRFSQSLLNKEPNSQLCEANMSSDSNNKEVICGISQSKELNVYSQPIQFKSSEYPCKKILQNLNASFSLTSNHYLFQKPSETLKKFMKTQQLTYEGQALQVLPLFGKELVASSNAHSYLSFFIQPDNCQNSLQTYSENYKKTNTIDRNIEKLDDSFALQKFSNTNMSQKEGECNQLQLSWKPISLANGKTIYINFQTGNTSFTLPLHSDPTPLWKSCQEMGARPLTIPITSNLTTLDLQNGLEQTFTLSHGFKAFLPIKLKLPRLKMHNAKINSKRFKGILSKNSDNAINIKSNVDENEDKDHNGLRLLEDKETDEKLLEESSTEKIASDIITDLSESLKTSKKLNEFLRENKLINDKYLNYNDNVKVQEEPQDEPVNLAIIDSFGNSKLNFAMDTKILCSHAEDGHQTSSMFPVGSYNIVHPYKFTREMLKSYKVRNGSKIKLAKI